jgi:ATP-grasp ribosomal peptide maturase
MSHRVVLVMTHWFDPTADHVIEELNRRRVEVLRFDAADFPSRLAVTGRLQEQGWGGSLRLGSRVADLEEVSGAYFRRPTVFGFGNTDETERAWALAEARAGLGGLLLASDRWLNHPHRASYAAYKPVQLAQAQRVGLEVPATIITSEPEEARTFAETVDEVIYKPMAQASPGADRMVYASVVERQDLTGDDADGIAGTVHMFQQRIKHEFAVRLTAVDDKLFAAAIHAGSEAAAIDWRSDYDSLTYEPVETPAEVRRGVLRLMETMGLRFGAFDFLVSADRGWVFLEVNPNGQWAWIETATGLPIASAIADALTSEDTR